METKIVDLQYTIYIRRTGKPIVKGEQITRSTKFNLCARLPAHRNGVPGRGLLSSFSHNKRSLSPDWWQVKRSVYRLVYVYSNTYNTRASTAKFEFSRVCAVDGYGALTCLSLSVRVSLSPFSDCLCLRTSEIRSPSLVQVGTARWSR